MAAALILRNPRFRSPAAALRALAIRNRRLIAARDRYSAARNMRLVAVCIEGLRATKNEILSVGRVA